MVKEVKTKKGITSAARQEDADTRILYVDGASNKNGSGISMMLISPERHKIHCALCFGFPTSNNKAEYDALIAGLRLARELQVHNLRVYSDTQLVVNQVNDIYRERGEKMVAYLEKTK